MNSSDAKAIVSGRLVLGNELQLLAKSYLEDFNKAYMLFEKCMDSNHKHNYPDCEWLDALNRDAVEEALTLTEIEETGWLPGEGRSIV